MPEHVEEKQIRDHLQKSLKDRIGAELAKAIIELYETSIYRGSPNIGLIIGGKFFGNPDDPLPSTDPADQHVIVDITADFIRGIESVEPLLRKLFNVGDSDLPSLELVLSPISQTDTSEVTMNGFHAPNYAQSPLERTRIGNGSLTGEAGLRFWARCYSLAMTGHDRRRTDSSSPDAILPNIQIASFLRQYALGKS